YEFGAEHIAPYAVRLTQLLISYFWRMHLKDKQSEGGNEEAAMTAGECLTAIHSILDTLLSVPLLYSQVANQILPLIEGVLSNHNEIESYDECIALLAHITEHVP